MTENETNLNVGSNIYMNTPYNGEQIRRAYETKPWKSDYEIYDDIIEEEQEGSDEIKGVVDLGLPSGLLWAECNLGASSPLEAGKYYQWGDTEGYTVDQVGSEEGQKIFSWDTYKYAEIVNAGKEDVPYLTKYCNVSKEGYEGYTDELTTLESSDDAATSELGNNWRIPTAEEFNDLLKGTTYEFDSNGNLILTSKSNGNTIMFPASGIAKGNSIKEVGVDGLYWSSSLKGGDCLFSWNLYFSSGKPFVDTNFSNRYFGFPIRPVNTSKLKNTKVRINVLSNVSSNGNLLGTVDGGGEYSLGETCNLEAIPFASIGTSYSFVNWTKNGEVVSTNNRYTFTVTEDATYVANFGGEINIRVESGGTVSGGGLFVYGETCTLVAEPDEGYRFDNWTKPGGSFLAPVVDVVSTESTYEFTVEGNVTYTANFQFIG